MYPTWNFWFENMYIIWQQVICDVIFLYVQNYGVVLAQNRAFSTKDKNAPA
jgi:hypothetical protein